jgi:hypothetical protein
MSDSFSSFWVFIGDYYENECFADQNLFPNPSPWKGEGSQYSIEDIFIVWGETCLIMKTFVGNEFASVSDAWPSGAPGLDGYDEGESEFYVFCNNGAFNDAFGSQVGCCMLSAGWKHAIFPALLPASEAAIKKPGC